MFQSKQFNSVGLTAFLLFFLGGLAVTNLTHRPLFTLAGALAGVYFLFAPPEWVIHSPYLSTAKINIKAPVHTHYTAKVVP